MHKKREPTGAIHKYVLLLTPVFQLNVNAFVCRFAVGFVLGAFGTCVGCLLVFCRMSLGVVLAFC